MDSSNKTVKKKRIQTTTGKSKTSTTTTTKTTAAKKESNKKTINNKSDISSKSGTTTEINKNKSNNKISSSTNFIDDKIQNNLISSSDIKDISKVGAITTKDNTTDKTSTDEVKPDERKTPLLTNSISDKKASQLSINNTNNNTMLESNGSTTISNTTATIDNKLNTITKISDNSVNYTINNTKEKTSKITSAITSQTIKDTKDKTKETISTTTSPTINDTSDNTKESKNIPKVSINSGLEDKPKGPKIPLSKRSSVDSSKMVSTLSIKKKDEIKSSFNEKSKKNIVKTMELKQSEEPIIDLGKLPTLPNMSSKPSNYLKPKTAQSTSLKQPPLSTPSPISQPPRKQSVLSTVDFGQSYFNDAIKPPISNHDPKGVFQGINNLYSDSGGKAPPSELLDTIKNHQTTLGKAKLPALPDINPSTSKFHSTPAVKTSAISGNVNLNDVFPMPTNNRLAPLSSINANNKINYLMEKENQHIQESTSAMNNFPQSRPIRTVLKPIQFTGDLPFGNEFPMEDINFRKNTPLDNIPSKPSIQVLQPLKSHNQIMPDFNNQSLNPLAKIPKIQRESPLIRKSKK